MVNYDELKKYLKEKNADYEDISQPFFKEGGLLADSVYDVECVGDWKHSHGYLRYLMGQIGYIQTDEMITEDNGSDWYGSIHKFVEKDLYELFRPKED